jgi:hypothetical protein
MGGCTVSIRSFFCFAFLACLCVVVSGCAMSGGLSVAPTRAASTQATIRGTVHGGQQPIGGATIQLYAANMTTDQGLSTPLLNTTVTTAMDGTGSFSITGDYMCPTSNPPVYLVAIGGNPGLGGTVNNTDSVLMASLGLCSTLTSSTYVVINEYSTAGMAYLVAPFMQDATHIGASPSNIGAMPYWFSTAVSVNDQPLGASIASSPLGLELNTFADILAACVNTVGGTSGDGSACGKLLQYTGGTDTATAALKMTEAPWNNSGNLFGLVTAVAPFQPYFSGVPTDLSTNTGYSYPQNLRAGVLDSNGHVWLYTGGWTYDTVNDVSTDVQGVITVYDNNFNQLFTVSPGTGGLYYPDSMAADSSGHVYAVNANNTISEFSSTGGAISPAGGWSSGITTMFTGTGSGDDYQDGSMQAGPIKIDSAGNIWGEVQNSTGNCYFVMSSTGTILTPATESACSTLGAPIVGGGAPDGSGNAWAAGSTSIGKVNSSGSVAVAAPNSTGCFAEGTTSSYADTSSLAYDRVTGNVWGYSELGAGVMSDGGTLSVCDTTPATIPTIAPPGFSILITGNPVSLNGLLINSTALDGAGNLWLTTGGSFASGTATGLTTFDGTVNFSSWLVEVSPSGSVLSPYNAGTGVYGYQPTGLGMNGSASVTGQPAIVSPDAGASLLGIDNSGNIWAIDVYTRRVLKISGLATANGVNY